MLQMEYILQVAEKGAGAKAGLIPTRRGLAGNIVLGDIIVGVNGALVSKSHCLFCFLRVYNVLLNAPVSTCIRLKSSNNFTILDFEFNPNAKFWRQHDWPNSKAFAPNS